MLKLGWKSAGDKDTWKSVCISGLSAGITSGLSKYIDGASGGIISKGAMEGASFKDKAFSALLENGLSNSVNVALESSINGDSFKESLERQGLNMLSGTIETLGSMYIGNKYHNNGFSDNKAINKATQLTLHAELGAITSKISGGDYLSGAVSGVMGELTAELIGEKYYNGKDSLTDKQMENITNISGLVAGLSSIVASKSQGKDIEDITTNAYVGQRIGQTVSKNNYLLPEEKKNLLDELDKCNGDGACKKEVQNKYENISDPRDEEFVLADFKCTFGGDCEDFDKIHYDLRDKLTKEGNEYYTNHKDAYISTR